VTTPIYALPYQELDDAPHGPDLGFDLATVTEGVLSGLDSRLTAAEAELVTVGDLAGRHQILDFVQGNVAANQTTSGGDELDLARLVSATMALDTSLLYRTDIQIIATRTTASNEFEVRLRQGSTGGTVVGSALGWAAASTAGQYLKASILWVPASSASTTIHVSLIRNSGSGTATVFYNNFGQIARTQVEHYRVGLASQRRVITV
jgi:hypothetical protein